MLERLVKIALNLLVIGGIGFAIGYFMWNKPHTNVEAAKPVAVDAAALYTIFSQDSVKAKSKYQEQVIAVTGKLHALSTNQQKQQVVTLETAVPDAYINCTMEQQPKTPTPGTTVTLKGICTGIGAGDADLGIMGDVYLVRCYWVNHQ